MDHRRNTPGRRRVGLTAGSNAFILISMLGVFYEDSGPTQSPLHTLGIPFNEDGPAFDYRLFITRQAAIKHRAAPPRNDFLSNKSISSYKIQASVARFKVLESIIWSAATCRRFGFTLDFATNFNSWFCAKVKAATSRRTPKSFFSSLLADNGASLD